MANAIPLLEGTATSGGYWVPTQYVQNAFSRGLDRRSAVAALANTRQVTGKQVQFTEYVGRPAAAFVAEGADKPATGAEYAAVTVDIKKIACTILYTEELLDDAAGDPTVLVNADVRASFADLIDSHALGQTSAGTLTSQFNSSLRGTTTTVELGGTADAIPLAVSSAINTIQANGYTPTGAIWAGDAAMTMRNARDANGLPLLSPFGADAGDPNALPPMYGLQQRVSTNLQTLGAAAAAGRVVGIVGDFTGALMAVRNDIRVKFSDQATVNVGGTDHRLWQQNKVASLWEARVGFVVHDLNRRFVAITNAA